MIHDLRFLLEWWFAFFLIGLIFQPMADRLFPRFFDRGYLFAKPLGLAVLGYVVWLAASMKLLPFTVGTVWGVCGAAAVVRLALTRRLDGPKLIYLSEEAIFLVVLAFWSFVRGLQPDIHGLEKFMDFGFVNAILRSRYFPPADMWFAGQSINYYYFGHYLTAFLTQLTRIPSSVTYNLMIATLCALTFTLSFSLTANLLCRTELVRRRWAIVGGLAAALLVTLGGNLHAVVYGHIVPWVQTKMHDPPPVKSYWYPDATRYIGHNPPTNDKTIHEFPCYSFIVSDLHGHVLDIPFVLTVLAFLMAVMTRPKNPFDTWGQRLWPGLLMGFWLAILFMTNSWDLPIYLTVAGMALGYKNLLDEPTLVRKVLLTAVQLALMVAVYFILAGPFLVHFVNFAKGVGLVTTPSPPYQLFVLWGYQLFFVLVFYITIKTRPMAPADLFVLVLCLAALGLLYVPEAVFVRDIYGGSYSRANTMFKLTYQAFIMLGLIAGYTAVRTAWACPRFWCRYPLAVVFAGILALPMLYIPKALDGFYGALKFTRYKQLDGLQFLSPQEKQAVTWLNTHVTGQPVVLEANGDSYTEYERISMATGLPTIQGWFVHEWLWRGDSAPCAARVREVATVYESPDVKATRDVLRKYKVKYIVIGKWEREKFKALKEAKLAALGKVVLDAPPMKIVQVAD